jgi:hypothetical protein
MGQISVRRPSRARRIPASWRRRRRNSTGRRLAERRSCAVRYRDSVSTDAQALLREAMSLPDEERADIAAELLASLDDAAVEDPAVARELWTREIERRARLVVAGEDDGQDWNDLRTRITNELTGG